METFWRMIFQKDLGNYVPLIGQNIFISSLNRVSFSLHIYNFDIKLNSGDQKPDENYVEDRASILIPLLKGNWSIIQTDVCFTGS